MLEIEIAGQKIGPEYPPFIVAEMSANHNHSLERALEIIEQAKNCGVHAVKLQTYTPDTITLDVTRSEFIINDKKSLWHGQTLYNLYKMAYTPWEWHQIIFDRCAELGLIAFSTPFDETAIDFLEELETPCYKIASLEITDLPLIQKAAKTGKPLIISTGGANLGEIAEAVETARGVGNTQIILTKCTTSYPAPASESNLLTLPHMQQAFSTLVGLSDHSIGIGVAIASIALGASLIEKHFTVSRDSGLDSAFSLDNFEMKNLVQESLRAWESLGSVHYGATPSEETSLKMRCSLYFVKNMKKGERITVDHVKSIRPGLGLPPKMIKEVIGRTVQHDVERGEPLSWDLL